MKLVALTLLVGFCAFAHAASIPAEDVDDKLRILEDEVTGEIEVLTDGVEAETSEFDGPNPAALKFKNREEFLAWKNRVREKL